MSTQSSVAPRPEKPPPTPRQKQPASLPDGTKTLALNSIQPIASEPNDGKKIRLAEDGEQCVAIRRVEYGVLVRLLSDGYLTVVMSDEIT